MNTRSFSSTLLVLLASLSLGACAGYYGSAAPPAQTQAGVLTDSKGMTLYTFDKDMAGSGKSTCNGPCASNWPPFLAMDSDKASGDYSIIVRDDGRKQWAFKGKPLYLWVKDMKPGDMTGDGFNKVWRAARP